MDQALAAWLSTQTGSARRAVLSLGPAALRRAIRLYYGRARSEPVSRAAASRHAREIVDAWSVVLGHLARAYPEVYLAEFDAGQVEIRSGSPTLEIRILAGLDLPAAAAVLRRYARHDDWLVRYHVVVGLASRTDAASIDVVNAAVSDAERAVRDEAARWVQRRDPRAAGLLYQQLLADSGLSPARRAELVRRLATARRLASGDTAR